MPDLLTIPRHNREELRVSLDEYQGHQFLSLRQFYDAGGGDMRPGRRGCTVPLWALEALHDAIGQALRKTTGPTTATVASLAAHRARIEAERTARLEDDWDPFTDTLIDPTDGGAA